jgi:hypothetical protein
MLVSTSNPKGANMESNITPNPQYQQVTVDVPEDRVAEFHAFFARFLAGPGGRRRGRHGRHGHGHGHGHHGRGCAGRREGAEQRQGAEQREPSTETTEI